MENQVLAITVLAGLLSLGFLARAYFDTKSAYRQYFQSSRDLVRFAFSNTNHGLTEEDVFKRVLSVVAPYHLRSSDPSKTEPKDALPEDSPVVSTLLRHLVSQDLVEANQARLIAEHKSGDTVLYVRRAV